MIPAEVSWQFVSFFTLLSTFVAQTRAVVTGVQGNGIGTRLEIRALLHDADAWNVYLLGQSAMQNASQASNTSYHAIAAIHGLPLGSYDGYAGTGRALFPYGFCTHDSNYFPPWHRAYSALFEQTLQGHALQQAQKFNGSAKTRYVAAANRLRAPYLDWTQTTGGSAYPNVFDHPTAKVYVPQGTGTVKATIPNPLYAYRFQEPPTELYWSPYTQDLTTSRNPMSPYTPNSPSNQTATRAVIDALQPAWHDRLYKVLTNYTDFNLFSNDAWIDNGGNVDQQDSIESIHNDFHNFVGGSGGHMSPLPTSAYDPIFWLHHVMVDRSTAIWQALHPDSWLESQSQVTPSYWYDVGSNSSSTTGLQPFAKDSKHNLWTSDELRDWTVLGYTYPELQPGWTNVTVRAAIDKLYSKQEDPSITATPPVYNKRSLFGSVYSGVTQAATASYEYFLNVRANKNALGQPYSVFAFFGEPPSQSNAWVTAPNLAGMMGVAAMLATPEELAHLPAVYTASTIPLNRALKTASSNGELDLGSPTAIDAFLTTTLNWLVLVNNGTVLEANEVPGLLLSVGQTVQQGVDSTGSIVPAAAGIIGGLVHKTSYLLSAITQGKPGGLCDEDSWMYSNSSREEPAFGRF